MENKVTVYTTTQCRYCVMVKNFLERNQIPFKEVNVEKDPIAMNRIVNKTGQLGVPQTEVNGTWVVGFDPERIMAEIK